MNKFMSLLLASSFLAAAPVLAFEGTSLVGNDEYMSPQVDSSYGPINTPEDEMLARRSCPRGWNRVPQYRWNHRTHHWEFSGWTCRRGHGGGGHPGHPGHGGVGHY
jgi:hypothetical protein